MFTNIPVLVSSLITGFLLLVILVGLFNGQQPGTAKSLALAIATLTTVFLVTGVIPQP